MGTPGLNESVESDACGRVLVGARAQLSRVEGVHALTPLCRVPAHLVVVGASAVSHAGTAFNERAVAVPGGAPHRVLVQGQAKLVAYLDSRHFAYAEAERLAE